MSAKYAMRYFATLGGAEAETQIEKKVLGLALDTCTLLGTMKLSVCTCPCIHCLWTYIGFGFLDTNFTE